jgi:Fe(3+) dicitrate transport protein
MGVIFLALFIIILNKDCSMRLLSIILILFLNINAYSQSVEGIIKIKNSQVGIPGVHIKLEGTKVGTITDSNGSFSIEAAEGSYVLSASSVGFKSLEKTIQVGPDAARLELFMEESIIEMPEVIVSRMTMTGGLSRIKDIPGSAHYLNSKELDKFSYGDINRVLRNIPGVNIQEEDGFGLRPNIGMRGTGTARSAKITVMEDGILMAPAPYAAPAAYYFPYVGRMQGVEVRKGSSTTKYGPYTTGGAINLISTQIPDQTRVNVNLMGGNFAQRTLLANAGTNLRNVGFLAETFQSSSDGFKQLDGGGNTGFDISDYHFKLRFNTNPEARVYQSVSFKVLSSSEVSNETYLGLTDNDYGQTPFRRYAGSQKDVMNANHRHYSVSYAVKPLDFMDVTLTAYKTEFTRNWYKLDKVRSSSDGDAVSISNVLDDPVAYQAEYSIVTGETSPNDNSLLLKNNNRAYYSRGLQSVIGLDFSGGGMTHDVEIGLRYHYDEMDRFQWVDDYRMENGRMFETQAGVPGTESNRIDGASALSTYFQYTIGYEGLTVIPGLRYEGMTLSRDDYGKNDPERTGIELKTRSNTVNVWIPGVGIQYDLNEKTNVFAGVHKGFSPPGSKEGTEPEESVNYEAGFRAVAGGVFFNATGFFNDYKNLLGVDLAAAGGGGSLDQFNGGAATVYGLEFELQTELLRTSRKFHLPLSFVYTYTKWYFDSSFDSEFDGWGSVNEGDELPYMPNNQLAVNAALIHNRFELSVSSKYVDPMRTVPGQGEVVVNESTDTQFVVDLGINIQLIDHIRFFGQVKNIFDSTYMVARRPAGIRPGMPRSFQAGIKASF